MMHHFFPLSFFVYAVQSRLEKDLPEIWFTLVFPNSDFHSDRRLIAIV
jgi:hypothetical protein